MQATPGVEQGGPLLSVGSGHSPQGDQTQILAGEQPKDWRRHPENWKVAGIFLNLGGDALEVVAGLTLASTFCCMGGWYSLSSSCSAFRSFSRLRRFLHVLSEPRLTYFSLPSLSGCYDPVVRIPFRRQKQLPLTGPFV